MDQNAAGKWLYSLTEVTADPLRLVIPKANPMRSAVSAVTERRPCTISFMRRAGAPMAFASRY